MSDRAKSIEQFVLAKCGGVMLPVPVQKVCQWIVEWEQVAAELIPSERRCPACNYRKSGAGQVKCPVDGSVMTEVTWREACLAASRIASTARARVDLLEANWPDGFAQPIGHEIDTKSLEEKIDILREQGLYQILFRNAGVGLMFFEPPDGIVPNTDDDSWKQYLSVHGYFSTLDEAVGVEFGKRS